MDLTRCQTFTGRQSRRSRLGTISSVLTVRRAVARLRGAVVLFWGRVLGVHRAMGPARGVAFLLGGVSGADDGVSHTCQRDVRDNWR